MGQQLSKAIKTIIRPLTSILPQTLLVEPCSVILLYMKKKRSTCWQHTFLKKWRGHQLNKSHITKPQLLQAITTKYTTSASIVKWTSKHRKNLSAHLKLLDTNNSVVCYSTRHKTEFPLPPVVCFTSNKLQAISCKQQQVLYTTD